MTSEFGVSQYLFLMPRQGNPLQTFDTYFVLLEHLASLSYEWSKLKKLSCFFYFSFKEIVPSKIYL